VTQERQRLIEKFGPSPFSDKADLLAQLEHYRESEARLAQARSSIMFSGRRNLDADDDEPSDDASANAGIHHTFNYAKKVAATEVQAFRKMRLDVQKEAVKTDDDGDSAVQDADITSTSSCTDEHNKTEPDTGDASTTNSGQVSSSGDTDTEAATDEPLSASDGIAVCLT